MADQVLPYISLTADQLVLLGLVCVVFILLVAANVTLVWIYRRLLAEDQLHQKAHHKKKKKNSDAWVYQVYRPTPSSSNIVTNTPSITTTTTLIDDFPNRRGWVRDSFRSSSTYDNLRAAEGKGDGEGEGRIGKEENGAIEEFDFEMPDDVFARETPSSGGPCVDGDGDEVVDDDKVAESGAETGVRRVWDSGADVCTETGGDSGADLCTETGGDSGADVCTETGGDSGADVCTETGGDSGADVCTETGGDGRGSCYDNMLPPFPVAEFP